MNDLIDRCKAIDALYEYKTEHANSDDTDTKWFNDGIDLAITVLSKFPAAKESVILCKECKYFEYDHCEIVNGVPLILAHEICTRIGGGVKMSENGFCFLAEPKENDNTP